MSPGELAAEHRAAQQRTADAVQAEGVRQWRRVDPGDMGRSWQQAVPRLVLALTAAQRVAAGRADEYTDAMLREQDIDVDPAGRVNPRALSGLAADGRPLTSLLQSPLVAARAGLARGVPLDRALAGGESVLAQLLRSEVIDAGRVADGVAVAARPTVRYVRYTTPPSCPRCAILAGRVYRYSQGFQRHPGCFVAGVSASGPETLAATRRWYEGELVIVSTASGKELPATGNHPILTDRGWLPANLLREGDDVVGRVSGQRALPLVIPDKHQVPTRIEDVWGAAGMTPLFQMPTTTEDFHGDGGNGKVDVVLADRLLRDRCEPAIGKPSTEGSLPLGLEGSNALSADCHTASLFVGAFSSTGGVVGGGGLGESFFAAHLGGADLPGIGHAADFDPGILQMPPDHVAADVVAEAEAVLALAGLVRGRDIGAWEDEYPPRWDAPASPFTLKSRAGYASRGHDLRVRLASQVELDRVVELRRVQWSGHVYNLTSAEGWFDANGLIVSNCDCIMQPTTEPKAEGLMSDPREMFDSGQIRGLSKADAQAIRDGADMNRVINAHRGMYTADGGRKLTKALAGGQGIPRLRLRPETIYREAASRDEAIQLLRLHGYIL